MSADAEAQTPLPATISPARAAAWSLLLSIPLTLWLYSGALFSWGRRVVGATDTEVFPFLWGYGWMMRSLRSGIFPMYTTDMDFPIGGVLWLKAPAITLLTLPVQLTANLPMAYTVAEALEPIFGMAAATGLGVALGLPPVPAMAGALLFGFSPHLLGEAFNGNLDAMDIGYMPLWLWMMVRAVERPGGRSVALGAGSLFLLLVNNQYYAIATALISGPLLLQRLWLRRRAGAPVLPSLLTVAGAVAIGLVLFAPLGYLLFQSIKAPNQLTLLPSETPLELPYLSDIRHLWAPLAPGTYGPPPPPFQDLIYTGLSLSALALLAPLVGLRRHRVMGLWLVLAVAFTVLSLGPVLFYDGKPVGPPIRWLPWYYLIYNKPVLGSMTLPHRMATPASLCLGLCLAVTLEGLRARLAARGRPRLGWAAVGVLAGGVFAEGLLLPPYQIPLASFELPDPVHGRLLKALPAPGAVLNVPTLVGRNQLRMYLFLQSVHERPVDGSLRMGQWPTVARRVPLLYRDVRGLMAEVPYVGGTVAPPADDPAGLGVLQEAGYRFVVLHRLLFWEGQDADVEKWEAALTPHLGPGLVLSDQTVIFALDPAVRATLEADARALLAPGEVLGMSESWAALLTYVPTAPDESHHVPITGKLEDPVESGLRPPDAPGPHEAPAAYDASGQNPGAPPAP